MPSRKNGLKEGMKTLFENEQSIYGPTIPLLNHGNWNPDLHPRNSIGEFTYTDGGRHGKSTPDANPQYDAFGNFNYGATGTAFGLNSYQLEVMAGWYNKSDRSGIPLVSRPYGDRPQDNYWIQRGIAYAHSQGY